MTIRYVGKGGNNSNDGSTWALRKKSLNSVESLLNAGDTVYVGPGEYYVADGALECDKSGSSGSPISYIGDVTGQYTDGVGGVVRLSGVADPERDIAIASYLVRNVAGREYRTFKGFAYDGYSTAGIYCDTGFDGLVVEDCIFAVAPTTNALAGIQLDVDVGEVGHSIEVRRCFFTGHRNAGFSTFGFAADREIDATFENCIFDLDSTSGIHISSTYGLTVKNCTFIKSNRSENSVRAAFRCINIQSPNDNWLYNSIIHRSTVVSSNDTGAIVDDYNVYIPDRPDPTLGVTEGGNTVYRPLIYKPPTLLRGFLLPMPFQEFWANSDIPSLGCGQSPPSTDFYGLDRPSVDAKKTRGAIQYQNMYRETTTVPSGEAESIKFSDAGVHQFFVPITNKNMKISIETYREANYAGTNPQMIIKQPGQSNRTQTDTGSASQWNELADSFSPATSPGYFVIEIRSNNTATSGSYAAFFGKLAVK